MKKTLYTLILAALLILQAGCAPKQNSVISSDEAKEVIFTHSPGAVITDCEYSDATCIYKIVFETDLGKYTASVNGKTGALISVTIIEDKPEVKFDDTDEDDGPIKRLTPDDALTIAIIDSDVSGSVLTVKNEYRSEDNSYFVIFRSGNKEFTYTIDAENGDVISSDVDMDA